MSKINPPLLNFHSINQPHKLIEEPDILNDETIDIKPLVNSIKSNKEFIILLNGTEQALKNKKKKKKPHKKVNLSNKIKAPHILELKNNLLHND